MFEIKPNTTDGRSTGRKYEATQNACKLCTPLGACLAFKGINNAITLLHGSQGCSTYIRRYTISHFREPVDIASSNFSEDTAVYGGEANLLTAIKNVIYQYNPDVIGIPTTCLSETIGDDVKMIVRSIKDKLENEEGIHLIPVSTPSYSGTHADGFQLAAKGAVERFAEEPMGKQNNLVNIFHSMQSPADIRLLKEIIADFGLEGTVFPDYSDTMDGGVWKEYERIPKGGTTINEMKIMSSAAASIEFGYVAPEKSAASYLEEKFEVKKYPVSIPIGIINSDAFFKVLEEISGRKTPDKYLSERRRLIDSYVDAHKYLFGKKVLIYGEEDLVLALAQFVSEIGLVPEICATGSVNKSFKEKIQAYLPNSEQVTVLDDSDFEIIREAILEKEIDLIIGNSKGYKIAREVKIPLVRVGFPIHDRIGAQRLKICGFEGTQELFDRVTNALLEYKQENSPIGYSYI